MTGKDLDFDIIHIDVLELVPVFFTVYFYISENDNVGPFNWNFLCRLCA